MEQATKRRRRGVRVAVLCLEWPSAGRHAGGVGRYVFRLCQALASEAEVTVITGPDPAFLDGVRFVPVDTTRPGGRLARYYVAPVRAARVITDLDADVVHSHGDDWPLAWRPGRFPPVVRTYHGRSVAEARSGSLMRRANLLSLAALETACRRRYARAVGVGPESADRFRCDALIPPVTRCIDYSPMPKDDEPLVAFIGGFGTRKRGDLALQAVRHARGVLGGLRFGVVGPEGDRRRYPAWVDFRSGLDDEDVRALVQRAWVLLAPSSYEGFGIPAWEAMSLGTPVLATPNPGIAFVSAGGMSCSVVTEDALGSELVRLLRSEASRATLAASGLTRAREIAELGNPARYVDIYNVVVAR